MCIRDRRSPSAATHPRLKRTYPDIDVVGLKAESRRLTQLFVEQGYQPDRRFNALHGYKRMIFHDSERHVDVFLDAFEMCHRIPLRDRLLPGYLALPLADLLMTKLQIVELNAKDLQDILVLLLDHEIDTTEHPDRIDASYLSRLTAADWGLFTTLSDNLARVAETASEFLSVEETERVTTRTHAIVEAMQQAAKTLKWRARASIGRRIEWYELPDEVAR